MTTDGDPFGAFVPDGRFRLREHESGPLSDITFAAKDVFDVRGRETTAGNPARGQEVGPAKRHAAAVASLLDAGAELVGKTVCDEFAYGESGVHWKRERVAGYLPAMTVDDPRLRDFLRAHGF